MRFLLLTLALVLASCEPAPEQKPAAPPVQSAGRIDRSQAGQAAPALEFEDGEGAATSLAAFRGKPVLVNLWATWCAPCIAEMPTLDALDASRDDIHVVTISQDMDGRELVDAFFEAGGYETLEPYLDGELALMEALKVESLPTTILYDARGREVWRLTGTEDWAGKRAEGLIGEAR